MMLIAQEKLFIRSLLGERLDDLPVCNESQGNQDVADPASLALLLFKGELELLFIDHAALDEDLSDLHFFHGSLPYIQFRGKLGGCK